MEIRRVAIVDRSVMGRGFRDWTGKDAAALRRKNADKLQRILAITNE